MINIDSEKKKLLLKREEAFSTAKAENKEILDFLKQEQVEKNKAEGRLLIQKGGLDLAKGIEDYGTASATASLLKLQGKNELREGKINADKIRQAGDSLASSNLLKVGASGTKIGTGSSKLVEDKLYRNIEADAANAVLQGNLKNIAAKFQAKQAKVQGASSLMKGAIEAGSSFFAGYKKGAFDQ